MDDQTMADKLCTASACGHLDKVLFLLQSGADVSGINKYGRTALQVRGELLSFLSFQLHFIFFSFLQKRVVKP